MGSIIANTFLKNANIEKIFYVCSKTSILPKANRKITITYVETVQNLLETMRQIIIDENIDVVIHSMAVSDYHVQYVTDSKILSEKLSNKTSFEIEEILSSLSLSLNSKDKISSNKTDLIIRLIPTPKVISQIKKWNNKVFLIGFKLLSNVEQNKLIDTAKNLMQTNDCDVVVANDTKNISTTTHKAYIIKKDGTIHNSNTKQEIANILYNLINN